MTFIQIRYDFTVTEGWDFFVAINQSISFKNERHLIAKIRNDILINSKDELNESRRIS